MRAHFLHHAEADQGFAGAAREDDHATPAAGAPTGVECIHRLRLIAAQRERLAGALLGAQAQWQRIPGHVAGEVLHRVADLDQRLLEAPTVRGAHGHGVRIEARAEESVDRVVAEDFVENQGIRRCECQRVAMRL